MDVVRHGSSGRAQHPLDDTLGQFGEADRDQRRAEPVLELPPLLRRQLGRDGLLGADRTDRQASSPVAASSHRFGGRVERTSR